MNVQETKILLHISTWKPRSIDIVQRITYGSGARGMKGEEDHRQVIIGASPIPEITDEWTTQKPLLLEARHTRRSLPSPPRHSHWASRNIAPRKALSAASGVAPSLKPL